MSDDIDRSPAIAARIAHDRGAALLHTAMPSSRDAAILDFRWAALAFSHDTVWNVGKIFDVFSAGGVGALVPLLTVEWHEQNNRYYSTECERDEFVAQAMVVLTMHRLVHGWSRKRAAQQLVIWEGKDGKSNLPNRWAGEIQAAKHAGGRLCKAMRHFAHEDNYYSFNQFYISSTAQPVPGDPKAELWRRTSNSPKGLLHTLAEEAVVQWALSQERSHLDMSAELLRLLVVPSIDTGGRALFDAHLDQVLRDGSASMDALKVAVATFKEMTWREQLADGHQIQEAPAQEQPNAAPGPPTAVPAQEEAPTNEPAADPEGIIVIGEPIGEQQHRPVATGHVSGETTDAHVVVETHGMVAAVVKTEPGLVVGEVRQGIALSVPRPTAQPAALVANGTLQASRGRRRPADVPADDDDESRSRRARLSIMAAWNCGDRVSCAAEDFAGHDDREEPFTGTIEHVHEEFRSCDIQFDDGSSHRVNVARLARLA